MAIQRFHYRIRMPTLSVAHRLHGLRWQGRDILVGRGDRCKGRKAHGGSQNQATQSLARHGWLP